MTAKKAMAKARAEGRLSHAYILFSQDGELARQFFLSEAKLTLAGGVENHRAERAVETNSSGDFLCFGGGKYTVEDAEKIVASAHTKPFEFECKVFLLCNFHTASTAVQNKLLKTIEEPPQNVHFFITAESFDLVLPTIRSRAVKFYQKEFEASEIAEMLGTYSFDFEKNKLAGILALGKLSRGLELLQDENLLAIAKDAQKVCFSLKSSRDLLEAKKTTDIYKTRAVEFLQVLQCCYRDVLMAKSGLFHLMFFGDRKEDFSAFADEFSTEALCEIAGELTKRCGEMFFGATGEGVLDCALLKIAEVKNLW